MHTENLLRDRELKAACELPFEFEWNGTVESNNSEHNIDSQASQYEAAFYQNLAYWRMETAMLSANNFDNVHYQWFIEMGKDIVPFIYRELQKGVPTQLVNVLNHIYPNVIKHNGFISLKTACEIWLSILQKKFKEKDC